MYGPVSDGMRLFRTGVTVAVVGYSDKPHRVSHKITRFLANEGNHIIGINPNIENPNSPFPVFSHLLDLKEPVDIVQVFRNCAALQELADEILALAWKPKLVWCQQGVVDMVFEERLRKAGIPVVMDACPYALRSYL